MNDSHSRSVYGAEEMATTTLLDDVMECWICTEVYTDPGVLPCVHTYCLKCIETWSKDKPAGDKLAEDSAKRQL